VCTDVLPFAETEPHIIGNRHRLVERAAYVSHSISPVPERGIAPPFTGEIERPIRSPRDSTGYLDRYLARLGLLLDSGERVILPFPENKLLVVPRRVSAGPRCDSE
jgi:hypothetical protein